MHLPGNHSIDRRNGGTADTRFPKLRFSFSISRSDGARKLRAYIIQDWNV
jgi:hypothetical protein